MKKKKYLKKFCSLLLVTMFVISGCSAAENENSENGTSKDTEISDVVAESGEEGNTSGYQKALFDRTKVDGKMACYFIGSSGAYRYYGATSHAGDGVLFIAPDGTTLLYDCNTPNNAPYIVHVLQQLGIEKIDYFVNSHPHIDHMGGFSIIARYFEIGQVYTPPAEKEYNGSTYNPNLVVIKTKLEEKGIPHSYLIEGDSFKLGNDVNVQVFNPPADFDYDNVDLNECSLLLKFTYGESSYLVGGDLGNYPQKLGRASEDELVAKYGSQLQADVSKINHHADPTTKSGTEGWLNAVNSKIYVGTMSEVPDDIELFKYILTGAETFHNGLDGTVLVYTDGDGTYDVQVEHERYTDLYGYPDMTEGYMHVE